MKKITIGSLAVILLLSLLLIGCGSDNGEDVGGDISEEPIKIVFNHTVGSNVPIGLLAQEFAKKVEEGSEGRVEFEFYWNSSLIPRSEIAKGVAEGIADISYFNFEETLVPIARGLVSLPLMGWPSLEAGTKIYEQLYADFPILQEEMDKLGIELISVTFGVFPSFHTVDKAVRLPEDLRGLKFIAIGMGKTGELIDRMGGSPMVVDPGDWYMSLNTNLVNGGLNLITALDAFGAVELLKYHTLFGEEGVVEYASSGICGYLSGLIMNPDTLAALPPDIKDIFYEALEWYTLEITQLENNDGNDLYEQAKTDGHEFIYVSGEDLEAWREISLQLHEEWIEEMEEKGVDVKPLYEEAKRLIEEYK